LRIGIGTDEEIDHYYLKIMERRVVFEEEEWAKPLFL
jgi:hypothetical protein